METDTPTLIKALRILVEDIQSGDGVANACIAEAADRLQSLHDENIALSRLVDKYRLKLTPMLVVKTFE